MKYKGCHLLLEISNFNNDMQIQKHPHLENHKRKMDHVQNQLPQEFQRYTSELYNIFMTDCYLSWSGTMTKVGGNYLLVNVSLFIVLCSRVKLLILQKSTSLLLKCWSGSLTILTIQSCGSRVKKKRLVPICCQVLCAHKNAQHMHQ